MEHSKSILDQLGTKYQTDKASEDKTITPLGYGEETHFQRRKGKFHPQHDYLVKYEIFFEPLRYKNFTLVEIGVGGEHSLRMWKEYFPNAKIVGIDIRQVCKEYEEDRIEIHIINGETSECAEFLKSRYEKPLIIIEDGSHTYSGQKTALESLFPFLEPGGYYVVEDLTREMALYLPAILGLRKRNE